MTTAETLLEMFTSRFIWDDTAPGYVDHDCENGPVVQAISTPAQSLDQIYRALPARFPPLFERLILGYRWQRAEVGPYCLLANPPGRNLSELLHEIRRDPNLSRICLAEGFIQFGKGPDYSYDPICFDGRKETDPASFPIVILDHEEILCNSRIRIRSVLADNFEAFIRGLV